MALSVLCCLRSTTSPSHMAASTIRMKFRIEYLRCRTINQSMSMRSFINIVAEAAAPGSLTYWFNPQTQEVVPCGDHGDAVADDPSTFGIGGHLEGEMESMRFPQD